MKEVWLFVFPSESEPSKEFQFQHIRQISSSGFDLHITQFRFLARISGEYDTTNYNAFAVGVIKGALCNLGIESVRVDLKMQLEAGNSFPTLHCTLRIDRLPH